MRNHFLRAVKKTSPLSITNTANVSSDANSTSYTYSSTSLGTASSDRYIVIAGSANTSSSASTTVTINGVSATQVVSLTRSGGVVHIHMLKVTTGTTADIVVTYPSTQARQLSSIFAIYGSENTSNLATLTSLDLSGSTSISTATNGVLLGIRYTGAIGFDLTLSWTDSLTAISTTIETLPFISSYSTTSTSSTTVSWGTTGEPLNRALCVASFQP